MSNHIPLKTAILKNFTSETYRKVRNIDVVEHFNSTIFCPLPLPTPLFYFLPTSTTLFIRIWLVTTSWYIFNTTISIRLMIWSTFTLYWDRDNAKLKWRLARINRQLVGDNKKHCRMWRYVKYCFDFLYHYNWLHCRSIQCYKRKRKNHECLCTWLEGDSYPHL